jgi:hypothetical protein
MASKPPSSAHGGGQASEPASAPSGPAGPPDGKASPSPMATIALGQPLQLNAQYVPETEEAGLAAAADPAPLVLAGCPPDAAAWLITTGGFAGPVDGTRLPLMLHRTRTVYHFFRTHHWLGRRYQGGNAMRLRPASLHPGPRWQRMATRGTKPVLRPGRRERMVS